MRTQVEAEGTLRPDGTVELDEKPDLPAGRVKVILQVLRPLPKLDSWATLQQIWAERQALGLQPRSAEAVEAELSAMRGEWEEHEQALERLQEEARRAREKPPC
jgi:hypothetical protein